MNYGGFTNEQIERLNIAQQKKKYGHLMSWKEICFYQNFYATPKQVQEIIEWSRKKQRGEPVYLPLMSKVNKKIGGEEE